MEIYERLDSILIAIQSYFSRLNMGETLKIVTIIFGGFFAFSARENEIEAIIRYEWC